MMRIEMESLSAFSVYLFFEMVVLWSEVFHVAQMLYTAQE